MISSETHKPQPLDDRLVTFAENVRQFVAKIPYSRVTSADCDQLLRSSGSVGANYVEAQEAMSRRDFLKHVRISRKEARESKFWLKVLHKNLPTELQGDCEKLSREAHELLLILGTIAKRVEERSK